MTDDANRELVRQLFGTPTSEDPSDGEPARGNYSPREGDTPSQTDDPMHEFVRALFTSID